MKRYILSLLALIAALSVQAQAFRADDPIGTTLYYGYVDKKGKTISEATFKLVDKEKTPEGTVLNILMETVVDGNPAQVKMKMTYTESEIILDKSFIMSNTIMDQALKYKDIRVDASGDNPTIPLKLKVDDELPNYTLSIKIVVPNIVITTKASTTQRKIVRKEEVITPAGTFEAFVLEEDIFSTVNILGININATGKGTSWVVPGMGIVKQDNANKKGKSTGGYQLIKIVKPEN